MRTINFRAWHIKDKYFTNSEHFRRAMLGKLKRLNGVQAKKLECRLNSFGLLREVLLHGKSFIKRKWKR